MNPSSQFSNLNNISFQGIISLAISFILIITAVILFFVIIGGGLAVILSGGGNKQATERGRNAITAGVVGLLIVFGAWAIMTLLESFFGVNLLSFEIP